MRIPAIMALNTFTFADGEIRQMPKQTAMPQPKTEEVPFGLDADTSDWHVLSLRGLPSEKR